MDPSVAIKQKQVEVSRRRDLALAVIETSQTRKGGPQDSLTDRCSKCVRMLILVRVGSKHTFKNVIDELCVDN